MRGSKNQIWANLDNFCQNLTLGPSYFTLNVEKLLAKTLFSGKISFLHKLA